MKKLFTALAFWLLPTVAFAQCTGVFPNNSFCGNLSGSPAPPTFNTLLSTAVIGPATSTAGGLPTWVGTAGVQLQDAAGGTINGNYTWAGTQIYSALNTFNGGLSFGSSTVSGTPTVTATWFGTGPLATVTTNGQYALGATATAGAVLKGQGSTNDVTVQNKSGTQVCGVLTGTTTYTCVTLTLTNPLAISSGGTGKAALTSPTVQTFTSSGAGTYTTPAGVQWIKVKAVGGGGGGGGVGQTTGPNGAAGGNTTFGTTLLVANGGGGGQGTATAQSTTGGTGGTVNLNGVPGWAIAGGTGESGQFTNNTNAVPIAGNGSSSCLAGGGVAARISNGGSLNGGAAPANSGAGGGGAAVQSGTTMPAAGGGAGGCLEGIIVSPNATYSFNVGASGAGGVGTGTNAQTGGAGAAGIIFVEEHYQP